MQILARHSPTNAYSAMSPKRQWMSAAAGVDLFLTAGGDGRILVDPVTKRNRYATTATPSRHEIFLSSSTASTITSRAYHAVEMAWAELTADTNDCQGINAWFDRIRARLLDLYGIEGSDVILTGYGTDAELIGLAIAESVLGGRLTNVVIAPAETGRGVLRAAKGAHFLDSTPFGQDRRAGSPLNGWGSADIAVEPIEIRDSQGNLRGAANVDAEARLRASAAIQKGRSVLLHRLETSKTGRSGLTVAAASQILAGAPNQVLVVVDCCQLRCSRERVQQLLQLGFMVAITGSKFFGGPPFSGALLLPPKILGRIRQLALPDGLADYSSRLDWSPDLRAKVWMRWTNAANLGLGLRRIAALSEMERFFALPDDLRSKVLVASVVESVAVF